MADAIVSVKTCRKCGASFVVQCKQCKNVTAALYRTNNRDKIKASGAAYFRKNRSKIQKRHAAYLMKNAEHIRAQKTAYYEKTKEHAKARSAAWHKANADWTANWHAKNREKNLARMKAWRDSHPESSRIHNHNRASRIRFNGGRLSPGLTDKLFKLQCGRCVCCGDPLGKTYQLDHIVPLARGGSNEDWNMQLLTRNCNREKHAKDPITFMQKRGFLL